MYVSKEKLPRYQRQLKNVEHLVIETLLDKKDIEVTQDELEDILDVLYEWRIIE